MGNTQNEVTLVLVADRANRSQLLRGQLQQMGIDGVIRRLPYSGQAIACARRTGKYRWQAVPDIIVFDYSHGDEYSADILRQLAFGEDKASVPVVVMTSNQTQEQLDDGEIDGGSAVMFSPTSLESFVQKMRTENRGRFFKALRTLYEYGPILVRTPHWLLEQDERELTMSA